MNTIKPNDSGAAVEDVQHRLMSLGYLSEDEITGIFDKPTTDAVMRFCADVHIPESAEVTQRTWAALVDASYHLGDRTLYLRMPYFHGNDVLELQQALNGLGFFTGQYDAIFGAHTELALRNLQTNLGLPSDGIAGAYTFTALKNLQHSWVGKEAAHIDRPLGFARVASVLEANALCLFGTDDFTRSVASRMSNLALATNPTSKIVSAEMLSVSPDESMLLVQISLSAPAADERIPVVAYEDPETLSMRLKSALEVALSRRPPRVVIVLPGEVWLDAGPDRSAQHFAITLLDALCAALA